jgi:hypothetical protein
MSEQREGRRNYLVDAFIFVSYCLFFYYVTASVWALFLGDADPFQRLGSLGVAQAIFGFAMIRLRVDPTFGHGWQLEIVTEYVESAFTSISRILETRSEKKEEEFDNATVEFTEDIKNQVARFKAQDRSVRVRKERQISVVQTVELTTVSIATLQWGYGDLFHCWINGKGWTTC